MLLNGGSADNWSVVYLNGKPPINKRVLTAMEEAKLDLQRDSTIPNPALRCKEIGTGKLPPENFPPAADTMSEIEPRNLNALRDAIEISDLEASRCAVGCLQLCGASGKILATDGRYLFVQSGYRLRRLARNAARRPGTPSAG